MVFSAYSRILSAAFSVFASKLTGRLLMVSQRLTPEVGVAIAFQPLFYLCQALLRTCEALGFEVCQERIDHLANDLAAAHAWENTLFDLQVEGVEGIEQALAIGYVEFDFVQDAVAQAEIGLIEDSANLDDLGTETRIGLRGLVAAPGVCRDVHRLRGIGRLANFIQVNAKEFERISAVHHLIADRLRRLIDVNGAGKEQVRGDQHLGEFPRDLRAFRRIEHLLLHPFAQQRNAPILRALLLHRAEELRKIVLDVGEVHLIQAEEVQVIVVGVGFQQKLDRRFSDIFAGDRVKIAKQVAVVAPVGAHREAQIACAIAQRFSVKLGEFRFAGAGDACQNDERARFEADMVVIERLFIKIIAPGGNIVLHCVQQILLIHTRPSHLCKKISKRSLRYLNATGYVVCQRQINRLIVYGFQLEYQRARVAVYRSDPVLKREKDIFIS